MDANSLEGLPSTHSNPPVMPVGTLEGRGEPRPTQLSSRGSQVLPSRSAGAQPALHIEILDQGGPRALPNKLAYLLPYIGFLSLWKKLMPDRA